MKLEIETHDEDRAHRRVLMANGRAVSRLWVLDRDIRLLGKQVSMGGIGGVRTEPDHRGKGHARRLLADTTRYMSEEGYSVSMLFGITDFYDKFGFLPALPEHYTMVTAEDARRSAVAADGYMVRGMRREDYAFVVDLHREKNRHRAGSIVRDKARFQGFERGTDWDQPVEAITVEDPSGEPVAYAVHDDDAEHLRITELNCANRRTFGVLLKEFVRRGAERSCEQMEFHLPGDHEFCVFLRRCGCHAHAHYNRMGGGMMRILNQTPLLRSLAGAMGQRLRAMPASLRNVELTFETDLDTTTLRLASEPNCEPRRLTVQTTQDRLMQLLVGYLPAEEVLDTGRPDTDEQTILVLNRICGRQTPYVDYADRF